MTPPHQASLFPESRAVARPRKRRDVLNERNREAGARILAHPDHYGGPQSLAVRWALLLFERYRTD